MNKNNKKIKKQCRFIIFSIIVVISFLVLTSLPVLKGFARKDSDIDLNIENKDQTNAQISAIQKRINQKAYEIKRCSNKIKEYRDIIKRKEQQIISLENEIEIFDAQIAKTQLEINKVKNEIEYIEMEISNLITQLNLKENRLKKIKINIAQYIRQIHKDDQKSDLELIFSNQPLHEYFNHLRYLKDTQKSLLKLVNDLNNYKREIKLDKIEYDLKKDKLDDLQLELEQKKEKLKEKQKAKQIILNGVKKSENKFTEMLELIQNEKIEIENEIAILENEVKLKLKELNLDFSMNPEDIILMWPVPNKGITAYYHDPEYPYRRFIGEHTGIDLRTLKNGVPTNGTPVKSAASGVVIKTVKNGKYVGNAIYIAHSDNLVTCYYHLSRIDVAQDQVIAVGEQIGLSGGMPGTYGAGLSTGPHLHFEVRLNGVAIDPLKFLP